MKTAPSRVGSFGSAPELGMPARVRHRAGAPADVRALSVLEARYPALLSTVSLLWGHPELTEFLARVAAGLDPRLRDIDPAALAELMLLGQIHRAICPGARPGGGVHSVGRGGVAWRPAVYRGRVPGEA